MGLKDSSLFQVCWEKGPKKNREDDSLATQERILLSLNNILSCLFLYSFTLPNECTPSVLAIFHLNMYNMPREGDVGNLGHS